MQVLQHSSPSSSSSSSVHCQIGSISSRENHQIPIIMSNRINQPLIFSIDEHLSEQHLTRLDLCSKNIIKIDNLPNNINFNIILLDKNEISKLEYLDIYPQLIQLSISHNRLTDIQLLDRLQSIQKLNLSYNLIDSIDCLRNLQNLVMLNISNNNIYSIAVLNACHALQSLDVSENSIQQIEDLSHLTSLKYLNLHRNFIDTLILIPRYWPKSLHTIVISDNEIQDLTEISYLTSFINLNTLYIIDNPCLSVVDERYGCYQPFDYRPYIINWCLSIQNLDGIFLTRKESLKAEWLRSQGKGRSFSPGEHEELVQYLTKVCGTDADERNDLHLSRIMYQQDLYNQQKQSVQINSNEQTITTSNTIKDTNEISKTIEEKFERNILRSKSINISSSVSTVDEPVTSIYQQQIRTPSPGCIRSTSINDDQITENSSNYHYTNYDNRPIRPLDQNMLQAKLDQYPVQNHLNDKSNNSHSQASTNSQQIKRTSSHLIYNANRYSPKTTVRGPTASSILYSRSNRNLIRQRYHRNKRQSINSSNTNALRLLNHSYENSTHRLTTTDMVKTKEQPSSIGTSNGSKNQHINDDQSQLKSTPINSMLLTQSTIMNNSIELQKLTTSVETMRTSILQAYLDLHERFTKTTELQTSALTTLWKKYETQNITYQHETEKLIQENRLLSQRIHELEVRLNTNQSKSIPESLTFIPRQISNLYPPLRAHISKRDAKSFFLHWIPNPLNEHRTILGYRIYIDDKLKGSIDSGRFEAIIDYIRDEGEYKIKLRTYNEYEESEDSNIVIARFRRQRSITPNSERITVSNRDQSDHINEIQFNENLITSTREQVKTPIIMDKLRSHVEQHLNNIRITPEQQMANSDEHNSPIKLSPYVTTSDNIVTRKPPKSPTSSPNRSNDKTSPHHETCNKVLFTNNNNNDSSSIIPTKRSPTRSGIMSRLTKSSHKIKHNNVPLNALPIELNKPINTSKIEIKATRRIITFQPDRNNKDHGHILAQQVPIKSPDISDSMNIHYLSTNFETLLSNSLSTSPPPIPPRVSKNIVKTSFDQQS